VRVGRRRVLAWLIDWLCILVWVAATAAVGVPLYRAGVIASVGPVASNLIGAVVVVLPSVIAAAWFESRPIAATPGKHALGLVVRADAGRPLFRVALVRNVVKIGLPWLVGHAAVFTIVRSSTAATAVPIGGWVLTAAAYVIPGIWIVSLFVGDGHTPYDRITGTTVVHRPEFPSRVRCHEHG
jgi:hypothetical protein